MKVHTNKFKEKIAEHGKELDSKITYTYNDEVVELSNEELNSITPHYEGGILKSVMKQLDIESKEEIPEGTELNYQFGIKVRQGGNYEIEGNTTQGENPTPSNPQPIETVTGETTIEVNGQQEAINLGNIELCKIGNYQDYIRKSTGKNLFDKNNANVLDGCYLDESRQKIYNYNPNKTLYISCQPNTTYTISKILSSRFAVATTNILPELNVDISNYIKNYNGTSITITTENNAQYLCVFFYNSENDTLTSEQILDSIQIEEGETATEYEPYGEVWYKHKEIGKVILDGTTTAFQNKTSATTNNVFRTQQFNNILPATAVNIKRDAYCNYFVAERQDRLNAYDLQAFAIRTDSIINFGFGLNSEINTLEKANQWLSTHNTEVYYVLSTPTTEIITNETLIAQLEGLTQAYEYLNFGNYIVKEVEKQEDTNSWLIKCYDKMLYSMVDYENLGVTYPITIRNYINAICNKLGLTFKNASDNFANYNRQINAELYLDTQGNTLGYTFRDVLDELAQVTGSTICINEDDDQLEIRYINDTGDTIDEEYLKDINVNFGEQYGQVNTVVLSRAGGSDKVYKSYPDDLPDDQKIAVEIADNQIMNFNDRADYLPDILNRLNGLQYYLNDYVSPGITYYDLCDRYNVQIGEETYSCVMFNDEINITQGLVENVHTDMPEVAKTDYTKADKTDRRINQTYIIVDKQNQTIESVVSNVSEQNNKISQITQTVDEINSKISDIADITISGESNFATFTLDNINQSEPIQIKVKPISDNISYLYPFDGLYPNDTLYPKVRTIRFHNNTTNEDVDYVLPDDLLIYDNTHYDEFYLDYDSQTCQVTKRCEYNADGTVSLLSSEQIVDYPYPSILLEDGDYTLTLLGYEYGYLFIRLMAKNIYTSQFYTKSETDSHINQKASEIELGVSQTLSNYSTTAEMNSAINIKANEINSTVSQKVGKNEVISSINQTAETIKISANKVNLVGYTTFNDLEVSGATTINGSNITTGSINANLITTGNIQSNNYVANTSGTKINLTDGSIDTKNFKVDSSGNITANNVTLNSGTFKGNVNTTQDCIIGNNLYVGNQSDTGNKYIYFSNNNYIRRYFVGSLQMIRLQSNGAVNTTVGNIGLYVNSSQVGMSGDSGSTYTATFKHNSINFSVQPVIGSDKRLKKDIKDIDVSFIDDLKIKEFEYKNAQGIKQIGLIAQDYEDKDYAKYFLNEDENGYYSITYGNITNALIQYCQELKKEVNELKTEINLLKGEKNEK